jgi:hypothetical protein
MHRNPKTGQRGGGRRREGGNKPPRHSHTHTHTYSKGKARLIPLTLLSLPNSPLTKERTDPINTLRGSRAIENTTNKEGGKTKNSEAEISF